MEVAMEDDLFFADLNRQISLLIMDDDDDPTLHCSSVSLQGFPQEPQHHPIPPSFFHQGYLTREIRGTGVFIPRSSQPRRKNRPGGGRQTTTKSSNRKMAAPPREASKVGSTTTTYSSNHNRTY